MAFSVQDRPLRLGNLLGSLSLEKTDCPFLSIYKLLGVSLLGVGHCDIPFHVGRSTDVIVCRSSLSDHIVEMSWSCTEDTISQQMFRFSGSDKLSPAVFLLFLEPQVQGLCRRCIRLLDTSWSAVLYGLTNCGFLEGSLLQKEAYLMACESCIYMWV